MNGRRIAAFAFLALMLGLPGVTAAGIETYWTTDSIVARTAPTGSLGDPWIAGFPPTFPSSVNKIWISVPNFPDPTRNKFLNISLVGDAMDLLQVDIRPEGFLTTNDLQPVEVKPQGASGEFNATNFNKFYRFSPQPHWERFELRPASGGDLDLSSIVCEINSLCLTIGEEVDLDALLGNASFEAPGWEVGNPRYDEVWVFPNGGVNTNLSFASFVAPPATGTWSKALVFTDPEGNPRPGGGVKFSSNGTGLTVNDQFDATIRLTGAGPHRYDIYSHDTMGSGYEHRPMRSGNLSVPGVAPWSMLGLALLTLAAGVLLTRRRLTA